MEGWGGSEQERDSICQGFTRVSVASEGKLSVEGKEAGNSEESTSPGGR